MVSRENIINMKDRFDFEQDIFDCWHIVDDIKQLHSMVCENNDTSKDDVANILGGMLLLYDDRFRRLMDSFEHLIDVGDLPIKLEEGATDYTPKYEKLYTELLTKLRIISETDEIRNERKREKEREELWNEK